MERLTDFCIRHRALVILVVLLVGALGVRAARSLPIDAVPDVTNVQVQVLTSAPTLGPAEIERWVTAPIEATLGGIPHVEEVRSLSRFGLSAITVVFHEGTDIHFARQLVSERLAEAREAIPEGWGTPEMGPISTGLGEIFQFEVRGEPACAPDGPDTESCWSAMELRALLDGFISTQLRPIDGVVEVNPFGGAVRTWEVQVDPARLVAHGLRLRDLFDALDANHASAGGGYLVRDGEQQVIRGEGLLDTLDDVAAVRIATTPDGASVHVRDVARVVHAPLLRQGAVTRDGRGEVVTAAVMMRMGANAGDVTDRVKARLDELAGALPDGVRIEPWYDRSTLVDRTIRTVATNLIEGGALVVVVLLLLLGNVRGGLLIAVVIPLSMLATFIVMRVFEVSGNLMSLGALDFGLIIDGAIVVIENVTRRLSETRATGAAVVREVRAATRQVLRPVVFGTMIIVIVYVPILTLQGIEGKMFRPMAVVVITALLAALIFAITLVPAAATWIHRGGVAESEPLLARLARRAYEPLLGGALRARAAVGIAALLLLAAGGWTAARMGAEFLPTLDEGAIAMQAIRPPSVSLEESVAATTRVEAVLRAEFPNEIETIVSRTGRAEIATDPMGVEISDIYLLLHPIENWKAAADREALVERIEATLDREVPGQNWAFSQPIALRTNELVSGSRADVAVHIQGPDLDALTAAADRVAAILGTVPGAADVATEAIAGLPSLRILVDRTAAARFGLDAADVIDAVAAIGGHPVGVVFEDPLRTTLQVRWTEEARRDTDALRDLRIVAPGGQAVPLASVARFVHDDGPAVINRRDGQRRVTVQVNVRGRDLAGFVADARARVQREAALPAGHVATWGGQFENLNMARQRLAIAVPAALLLIFALLFTTFGSARPAVLIFLAIPMAAVGGVFALALRGMPFSISAAVGFIALSGIAVLNGVVMVSCIRELQAEGMTLREATERGAQLRLRSVLMTALTDGIGFLPMALSTGAGAEVQRPLATVVLGGLVTATALTLFVLPVLYSRFGGAVEPDPLADEHANHPRASTDP